MTNDSCRSGLSLVELLVIIAICGVLVVLLIPATRTSREAARRMSCSNNMKQVGLALHNYHAAYQQWPLHLGGTYDIHSNAGGTSRPGNNRYRLSFLVGLLPFIEQQQLWEQVSNGKMNDRAALPYAPMGPAPWTRDYDPWQSEIPTLRCPSDPGFGLPGHGRTNLAACLGDATHWMNTGPIRWDEEAQSWLGDRLEQTSVSGRGVFVPRKVMRLGDITDGTSTTIMVGEIATDLDDRDKRTSGSLENLWSTIHDDPAQCRIQTDETRPLFWIANGTTGAPKSIGRADQRRGLRWADGAAIYTSCNTILPPNAETCLAGGDAGIGALSVSSRHQGGAHVILADGAIKFVTDSIDVGNLKTGSVIRDGLGPRAPESPSPFGLWGAIGTRASQEDCATSFK